MTKFSGKSKEQSLSDVRGIIRAIIDGDSVSNVVITDINDKTYKTINGDLKADGIEINKGMISTELKHDFLIPYFNIKKIEDKVRKKIIFEKVE